MVYTETGHTRSSACKREAAIKKLKREEKLRLIALFEGSRERNLTTQGVNALESGAMPLVSRKKP